MASNEAKLRVIIGVVTHLLGKIFTPWSKPARSCSICPLCFCFLIIFLSYPYIYSFASVRFIIIITNYGLRYQQTNLRSRSWTRNQSFVCIVPIMWILIFCCGCVKCSILCKVDNIWFTICACFSWEMALNVGLGASFDNVVTMYGVWVHWIYWPLVHTPLGATSNYSAFGNLHTLQITTR
jgi:hypothetical protein